MAKELTVGDTAPAFRLPATGGETVASTALKGRTIILYFYPKDDTSGCTREAIDFTAHAADFAAAGALVIGVSKDSVASHEKFARKHDLSILLASDESGKTLEDFGVWVEKSMYGRVYMGIERATFLIDAKGRIAAIWRKVKVPGHASAVLKAAQALHTGK
jgi:peroxiredoxin Q/BCP